MIADAKATWIEITLEDGMSVPEPVPAADEYSGKFNLRILKSLHRDLRVKLTQKR